MVPGCEWDSMMAPFNNIIQRTPHIHREVGDLESSEQETMGVVSCVSKVNGKPTIRLVPSP